MEKRYKSFKEFYPYYLSEHLHPTCRLLHFLGTLLIVVLIFYVLISQKWLLLCLIPVLGYSFAWAGHFFFEKNRPATFTYPWYSLLGDWVLFGDILLGKQKIKSTHTDL